MPQVYELPSGRWRVQWFDSTGRHLSAGRTFPTKTAAKNFGQDREAEVRQGIDRDPLAGRVRLKDWSEQWMAARVAEPRTLSKEQSALDRHVLPALGKTPLDRLDFLTLQGFVKHLETDLAPATVRSVFVVLSGMLGDAVRSGRLVENPSSKVRLPTLPPPTEFFWTREEVDAILLALPTDWDRIVVETFVGTGMRWGELAGLHADRVNLLGRRLMVAEVLSQDKGFRIKAYPKGRKQRPLPLDPDLRDALSLVVGEPLRPCGVEHPRRGRCTGLVFHADGRPLSRFDWPREVFRPALVKAKVRPGRVHDLRHTFASWLVMDGIPLHVVQRLLGHSSIRVTERYAHLAPDALDDERLLRSLAGGKRLTVVEEEKDGG